MNLDDFKEPNHERIESCDANVSSVLKEFLANKNISIASQSTDEWIVLIDNDTGAQLALETRVTALGTGRLLANCTIKEEKNGK